MQWIKTSQGCVALHPDDSSWLTFLSSVFLRVMLSTSLEMKTLLLPMCPSTWSNSMQVCVFSFSDHPVFCLLCVSNPFTLFLSIDSRLYFPQLPVTKISLSHPLPPSLLFFLRPEVERQWTTLQKVSLPKLMGEECILKNCFITCVLEEVWISREVISE